MSRERRSGGRATRILTALGILVPVVAGITSLLFYVRPSLKPCLGGANAAFTGAPVFPHERFQTHLLREGARKQDVPKASNVIGAEVRFSYRANNLRGAELPLTWSLLTVERDGTLGAVVPSEDRLTAMIVSPDSCSESGGKDLFVHTPSTRQRYRVVLELYRNPQRTNRLALFETATFHG